MTHRSIIFALLSLLLPSLSAAQQWQNIAPMKVARDNFSAAVLHDGRILVVGGFNPSQQDLSECEIYDPNTDQWTVTGSMAIIRDGFSLTTLGDGRVIVADGAQSPSTATNTCEIFDPTTGSWKGTAPLSRATSGTHVPLTLPDSTVLFIGGGAIGYDANNVDRFDFRTESMTQMPSMPIECYFAETAYSPELNGVINAGGNIGNIGGLNGDFLRSTQFFSFRSHSWQLLDSLLQATMGAEQLLSIPDSGLYLFGGKIGDYTTTSVVEHFNLKTRRWESAGNLAFPTDYAYAFQINRDSVLVVDGTTNTNFSSPVSSSWYSISRRTSWPGPRLITPRAGAFALMTETSDLEHPCYVTKSIYVFGGNDSSSAFLSSCEKLSFSVRRDGDVASSPSVFNVSPCSQSLNSIGLSNLGCESVQLTKVEALDSGTSVITLESLPMNLAATIDTLHFRAASLSTSTIIPVRLTFSGPSGIFTKFVYLTQSQSVNSFPLTLPMSVSITASLCDNLNKAINISNHSCSTVQILNLEFSGADSNQFRILNDLMKTTLAPGDSTVVLLSCNATTASAYHAALDLQLSNGTRTFDTIIQITATVSGGSLPVQLRMTDLENDTVGDTISVPVRIYGGNSRAMSGFALDMRYNTKLLNLLPPAIQNTNSANTYGQEVHHESTGGLLTVEGPMQLNPTLPLVTLRFATIPTDSLCTTLVLNSCAFTDTSQNTLCPPVAALDSVQICLLPSRSQGIASSSKLAPTGISNILVRSGEHSLTVTYSSISTPRFSLVDELGRSYELTQGQPSDRNTLTFSLGSLPSGFYLLHMRNAYESISKGFIYLK